MPEKKKRQSHADKQSDKNDGRLEEENEVRQKENSPGTEHIRCDIERQRREISALSGFLSSHGAKRWSSALSWSNDHPAGLMSYF